MVSDEVRIGEAVASLTARLTTWGIEDPHRKAAEYVRDMVREGWRPRALAVNVPTYSPPPASHDTAEAAIQQARAALAQIRARTQEDA